MNPQQNPRLLLARASFDDRLLVIASQGRERRRAAGAEPAELHRVATAIAAVLPAVFGPQPQELQHQSRTAQRGVGRRRASRWPAWCVSDAFPMRFRCVFGLIFGKQ